MAVGTGIGFDLDALAKALEKADNSLDRLLTKNKKFGEEMIQTFLSIGAKGVEPFLAKLKEQKAALEMLANVKTDGASAALKQLTRDAKNALDQTNALINSFGQLAYASENRGAKNASMQYAKEYEDKTRFYERWINETYLKEQERTQQEAQQANERAKNSSASYQKELREKERFYLDWINKTFEADEKRRKKEEDAERKKNERLYAERAKLHREANKKQNQTYDGAIAFSKTAKTLAREIQAVKNLEAARAKLSRADADYARKLDNLNTRIRQHNKNIERATSATKEHNNVLSAVGRGVAAAFSVQALRGYVNQMIKVRGEMELQQRSIQAILQNKDAANEVWQKTIDLAVRSPFRIKDLVTYTKQLAAYRVESDKLFETNKMLADVSAGLGVDMQRLILAFGQVKAANFLRGTELRQFTEAGIPMLDELAKHFNDMNNTALTSADVFEMISKRMVLFEDVEAVFERMTSAGGTFYRMQEIQSETLRGQISNLKDSVDIMLNSMGKEMDGTLKTSVKAVKLLVDNYEKVIPILKTSIVLFAIYKTNALWAARSITTMKGAWDAFAVSWGKFSKTLTMNPWMLWLSGIVAVGSAIYKVWKQFNDVNKAYNDMLNQQADITAKFFKTDDIDERKKALKELIDYANKEYEFGIKIKLDEIPDDEVNKYMNNLRQRMIEANAFGAEFQKELIEANLKTKWNFADWNMFGIFEQGLNKDIDQMGNSYDNLNRIMVNKLSRTIDDLSAKWDGLSDKEKEALESLKAGIGEISGKEGEDMVEYFDRLRENYQLLISSGEVSDGKLRRQLNRYQRRMDEAYKEFETFIAGIDETVMGANEEDRTIFLNAAIDDAKTERNWSEFEETKIRKWLEKKYKIELTPKIVEGGDALKAWQDSYNDLFRGKTGFREIRSIGTSQKQVIEQLNAQYESTAELLQMIQLAGEDSMLAGGAYEGENLEKLKTDLADIREQLDWFGAQAKKDDKKESASIKILQKRINLLKEVNKKYLELEKTFDAVTAKEKVMEAYSDTFREAFEGTGVDLDLYKVMTETIVDASKVGDEAGSALTEGMLEKLKELESAGTYIRSFSDDLVEEIKKAEGFRAKAYQDAGGVWTQGYGETQGIEKNKAWTEEFAAQRLQTRLTEDYAAAVNKVLDANKDLIVTQEQYNALVDLAYQGGSGAVKNLVNYAKNIEQGSSYIERISEKIKKTMGEEAAARFGETFVNSFKEAETIQERMALLLQTMNLTIKGKINKDWYEGMQARSDKRAAMFSGDLDIANQLETVLVRIAGMDFTTTEGMVEALGKLKEIAEKEGPEAKNILSQAISGLEAEIGLRVKKEADKELNDEVQELFDQYDLSVELKKLNIPSDLAKSLFDVDYLDLDGLKKAVQDQEAKFVGTDMEKEYKGFLDKIDDMEDKAAKERMKTYVKYLQEGMSERVKLKIEELRKLKEIEESDEFTPAQKERIKANVSKEARAEQQAQEWKDFQGSEMYTMMFEDLEFLGTKALDVLKNKLEELKGSLKDLPASEVKEIIGQISKIEDITIQRNPFISLRDAMKEVRELEAKGRTEEVLQEEFAAAELKRQSYQEELDAVTLILGAKENEIDLNQQSEEWQEKYAMYLGMQTSELEQQSMALSALVTGQGMVASNAAKDLKAYADARKALAAVSNEWGTIKSLAEQAYGSVKEVLESMGVESDSVAMSLADSAMNMVDLVFQAVMFDMQLKVMTAQAQLLGVAMNTALGPIGWIVLALQAVATLLSAILGARDKALQKTVEDNLATVEKLQKTYEDLEDSIDNAWDTASIQAYNQELKATTQSMIDAQKAAIAAQEKRKGANKEGSDAYNELQEMKAELDELEAQLDESLANSFSKVTDGILDGVHDAAREFTDAWWDAFVETGDGLKGLEENFNEMFLNLAKNQAAMQITGAFADRWKKDLEKYINEDDTELTKDEAKKWAEEVRRTFPELSNALEGYLGVFKDMASETQGAGLSALSKSIQGVSEETAQVIEALLNSMRFTQAETYQQVKEQTGYIKDIRSALRNITKNGMATILEVKLVD